MAQIRGFDKLAGISNKHILFYKSTCLHRIGKFRKRGMEREGEEEREELKEGKEGGKTGGSFTTVILEEIL